MTQSELNILVRVNSRAAITQLKALGFEVREVSSNLDRSGSSTSRFIQSIRPNALQRFGSQLQWTGRQLVHNFTVPIVAAGVAAAKFELDNERAMTGVTKVYGDGSKRFNKLTKTEIPALGKAFEALSNEFAVNRSEVIGIAADWAQAGASGLALAKSTKLTLETMILGEMDAVSATQALISIQAQYGQSTSQLSNTIDVLNQVENQTGITLEGLVQGFARAAGVARASGVDVRHLAALLAALTPAAGSASQAGNALKTIFSRILAPTKQASDLMDLMHLNTKSVAWESANGAQKLEIMAKSFKNLTSTQQAQVSSMVASRYQINKFNVLMRDITNQNGYYQKSLDATASATKNYKQRVYELNTVLNSNPQRLKQAWVILQNALADIIQPLIPAIVYLAQRIAALFTWFENLNPSVQKLVGTLLILLALLGPVAMYVGSVGNLFGTIGKLAVIATGLVLAFARDLFFLITLPIRAFMGLMTGLFGIMISGFDLAAKGVVTLVSIVPRAIALLQTAIAFISGFAVAATEAMVATAAEVATVIPAIATALPLAIGTGVTAGMTVARRVFVAGAAGIEIAAAGTAATISRVFVAGVAGIEIAAAAVPKVVGTAVAATEAVAITAGRVFAVTATGVAAVVSTSTELAVIGMREVVVAAETTAAVVPATFTVIGRAAAIATAAIATLPELIAGIGPLIATALAGILPLIASIGPAIIAALTSPFGLAILAIIAFFGVFHRQIALIWNNITNAFSDNASAIMTSFEPIARFFDSLVSGIAKLFYKLPVAIQNAMLQVVRVVEEAALKVYELFQYLNPFAHHSPSLVENTQKGTKVVRDHHKATADSASNLYSTTSGHIKEFNQATNFAAQPVGGQFKSNRQQVAKVDPGALASFDKLIKDLNRLQGLEAKQQAAVDAQKPAVDRWAIALDKANAKLSNQQDILDRLTAKQQKLQDAYDAATSKIQTYSQAPIKGMQKFSNELFRNQMQQNRLQLAMDKWTDKNGSLDDLSTKLNRVNGALEVARGTLSNLQAGGAGSEITGVYSDQISALEKQQKNVTGKINNSPMAAMNDQLTELQRHADELNLEQSLKFDPLTRQVDRLANGMKELPFDEIIDKIKKQKAVQDGLQPSLDHINQKVREQTRIVDRLTLARDKVQRSYDRENNKLTLLQDRYNKTSDAIQAVTDAITRLDKQASKSSSSKAGSKLTDAQKSFLNAKGNFPDPGFNKKIGREGGLGDQSKLIDNFTKNTTDRLSRMFGKFDMFAPIKEKWKQFTAWWDRTFAPFFHEIAKTLGDAFSHGDIGKSFGKQMGGVKTALAPIGHAIRGIANAVVAVAKLMGPDVIRIFHSLVDAGKQAAKELGPPLKKIFVNLGPAIKGIGVILLAFSKIFLSIISYTVGPILWAFIKALQGAFQIIGGLLQFIASIVRVVADILKIFIYALTGQFGKLGATFKDLGSAVKGVLDGIVTFIQGFGNIIYAIISGALALVVGSVKGFVMGIFNFFKWLYDELVGHSIVPDIVHGIIKVFKILIFLPKWIWTHILKPVVDFFKWAWTGNNGIKSHLEDLVHGVKDIWNGLKTIGKWVWDHVLKPVVDFFKSFYRDHISWVMGQIKDAIEHPFQSLSYLGHWIWDHVLSPVVDAFKSLWKNHLKGPLTTLVQDIKSIFTHVGTWIAEGINLGISAVDALIKGLNWIGSNVPGLSFQINEISKVSVPKHASGAILAEQVGSGFRTAGARAIVGEGNPSHPEYVIPTDPRHRGNAMRLLSSLMGDMALRGSSFSGGNGLIPTPAYGIGGFLSHAAGSAWDKAKGAGRFIRKEAVTAAFQPFLKAFDLANKAVPNGVMHLHDWLNAEKNTFYNWAKGTAGGIAHEHKNPDYVSPAIPAGAMRGSAVRSTWRILRALGMSPIVTAGIMGNIQSESSFDPFRIEGGGSSRDPRAAGGAGYGLVQWTPGSKLLNYLHGQPTGLQSELTALVRQLHSGESAAFAATKAATSASEAGRIFGLRYERYALPEQPARAAQAQAFYDRFHGTVHMSTPKKQQPIPGMATGGIVRRRLGGTLIRVGEGGYDEAVTPVTRRATSKPDTTTVNIYGNLEFPNIQSGDDAQTFIRNLKSITEKS